MEFDLFEDADFGLASSFGPAGPMCLPQTFALVPQTESKHDIDEEFKFTADAF